ncbi:MRL1, partial [Symbiodinium sp. CCMP2456]
MASWLAKLAAWCCAEAHPRPLRTTPPAAAKATAAALDQLLADLHESRRSDASACAETHLQEAAMAAAGVVKALERQKDGAALEQLLLQVTRHASEMCIAASEKWGFPLEAPYLKAAQKVRRRTPYMPGWGDGSAAKTCGEAQSLWKKAKAMEKQMKPGEVTVPASSMDAAGGSVSLIWVVHELVTLCPWTSSMDAGSLMKFIQDECTETLAEITALHAGNLGARSSEDVIADLVAELGDVQFTLLLALFISGRDFGLDPVHLLQTLSSQVRQQKKAKRCYGKESYQDIIAVGIMCTLKAVMEAKTDYIASWSPDVQGVKKVPDLITLDGSTTTSVFTIPTDDGAFQEQSNLATILVISAARDPDLAEDRSAYASAPWYAEWCYSAGERVAPDSYAGSAVLRTVSRGRWDGSLQLWSWLHQCSPSACDEFTGSAVLNGCARNRRWAEAVGTLATLRAWGGRLDVVTCSAAVSACERAQPSQWPRALRMLRETPEDPNEFTFSAAASACEKANLWQNSLGLLFELRRTPRKRGTPSEQGPKTVLQPTVVSHAATLSACAGGRKWPWVMWLFQKIQYQKDLDVVVFGAVITACDALGGRYWQLALSLLQRVIARGLRTSAELLGAGVKACEAAMQWPWAMQLLRYHRA